MTNAEWREITAARELLALPEQATLAEIKKAYRRLAKKHHPDLAGSGGAADGSEMRRLVAAYQLLMAYCREYRFPLAPGADQPLEGEDWWMERFGDDPLWGPGRRQR
jgi:hypothetical protein